MRIEQLLAEARSGLERFSPEEALAAMQSGAAVLVDIRALVTTHRVAVWNVVI